MRSTRSLPQRWRRPGRRRLVYLLAALCALVPITTIAAEILRDDTIVISAPIDDDVYLFGADIRIDSSVSGDVTAFGARIRITGDVDGSVLVSAAEVYILGDVGGNLVIAARTVTITGDIGQSVRVVAGKLSIHGSTIGGDLVAAVSELMVDTESPVGGDVRLRAGNTELLGGVAGEIRGSADKLDVGGAVGGAIDVRVERLRFVRTAVVASPIRYTSDREYLLQRDALVTGVATRVEPDHPSLEDRIGRTIIFVVFRFIWAFGLGLFLLRVAPDFLDRTARTLRVRPVGSLGYGLLAALAGPLAIMFALITVIGLPVALVMLALFILALYASQIIVALVIGNLLATRTATFSSEFPEPCDVRHWPRAGRQRPLVANRQLVRHRLCAHRYRRSRRARADRQLAACDRRG